MPIRCKTGIFVSFEQASHTSAFGSTVQASQFAKANFVFTKGRFRNGSASTYLLL